MLRKLARMLLGRTRPADTLSQRPAAPLQTTGNTPSGSTPSRSRGGDKPDQQGRRATRGGKGEKDHAPPRQRARRNDLTTLPESLQQLDLSNARVIPRTEHNISRRDISPNALKVLYRLNDAGYQGFLVGGGVRDLLLGGQPKDFDVSTNATPEQTRDLFRQARVIGRRFKIAHVRFGREIIEVTTFRAHHDIENEVGEDEPRRHIRDLDSAHSSTGMILRDNVYGSINEDAARRDFTVNALYYTTNGFFVLDFVNGLADIDARLIRMIGDPETRYREDPVRMLRAIRLAAKLDFTIEDGTEAPINALSHLLGSISPARLFDETVKFFTAGKAEITFDLLRQYKVADYLFAATLKCLKDPESADSKLVRLALQNTDTRLAEGKSVTPAFLYAALLWPPLQTRLAKNQGQRQPPMAALHQAATEVIGQQQNFTSIPKRFTAVMREMWELQWRLTPRNRRNVEAVFAHQRFRAAYDFLLLREEAEGITDGPGLWWTRFQLADQAQQQQMIEELQASQAPRKRRPRRRGAPRKSESAS